MKKLPLVLSLVLFSCAPVLSALPTVIAAITDGMQILDMIEQHSELAFTQMNVNQETRIKVHNALAQAKVTLNAALRTAQHAEEDGKLNQASIDEAFAAFKEAYEQLLVEVKPLGVSEVSAGGRLSARASTSEATLTVPRPEALALRVPRAN